MKLEVIKGDITRMNVDVIVNAANRSLLGGGGVDGAIHRAGGPEILAACMEIRNRQGGCKVGEAVITTAGRLPAKYVIHTVGPVWNGGNNDEPRLLALAYRNSMQLAIAHGVSTIAFPNISTGIYGYPKDQAAAIAIHTVHEWKQVPSPLSRVIFVCYDTDNYALYADQLGG